jgi:signal transduction histidine kinase/CheY-like chemotaxis protein
MLQTLWKPRTQADDSTLNLAELYHQLTVKFVWLLMGSAAFSMWLILPSATFPVLAFVQLALLLLLAGSVFWLIRTRRLAVARYLLVAGLALQMLAALWLQREPWIPFLAPLAVLLCSLLVTNSGWVLSLLVLVLAFWLSSNGYRDYPVPVLAGLLSLSTIITWIAVRTLYTLVQWVSSAQRRANRLLEEVRVHRGELSQTLKTAELANARLRRAEGELVLSRKQAEEARQLKEQFAANVSHELRTPLNLILGFSEMMHLSPQVYGAVAWTPILRQDVYQIYRSSRHLLEMIDDILALSKLDIAGFVLTREPTEIAALLSSTAEIARDLFRTSPVKLTVDLAGELPSLSVDRTRIRQVLLNLLNNAFRFTEEGIVCLAAEVKGGELVVTVSDTGMGIPADRLPHLFEEFYQVDLSLRRSQGGAGLGLAISKRFVEAHDGRIYVESQEGVGSTFSFALPIPEQRIPLSRLHLSRELDYQRAAVDPLLLAVDPDPAIATLIQRHLNGFHVQQVADPEELPALVEHLHPRAVVVNRQPGQAGSPIAITTPVLIVECSLPSRGWIVESLSIAGSLEKPILAEQLLAEIARLEMELDKCFVNVLVVDDDRGFCQLITRILEASGRPVTVWRAYEGESALRLMDERLPDLLLLDLLMPGMDGTQLLARMQQEPRLAAIPVLLLTATRQEIHPLPAAASQIRIHRAGDIHPREILQWLPSLVSILNTT